MRDAKCSVGGERRPGMQDSGAHMRELQRVHKEFNGTGTVGM